jgi:hypothetical protein
MANVLLKRCTGPVQALRIFSGWIIRWAGWTVGRFSES